MHKPNGTLVNYYFHCERQCWLHGHKINLEDNSELVKTGKALHDVKLDGKPKTELSIDGIKVDQIKQGVLIEYKKSDADLKASVYQLLYYLYICEGKGIALTGKLHFMEKNQQGHKTINVKLTHYMRNKLKALEVSINALLEAPKPPSVVKKRHCSKCAYMSYCML